FLAGQLEKACGGKTTMIAEVRGATVVGEIEIDAPPESVFDAMTDPAQLAEWWGSPETYRTHDWKVDLRPGGTWSCQATSPGGAGTVHGVYIAVDRPRVLAYTWNPVGIRRARRASKCGLTRFPRARA